MKEKTKAENPKNEKPATVYIRNTLPAGRLFTSVGIIAAGVGCELPKDEAKRFVEAGKAQVVIPE